MKFIAWAFAISSLIILIRHFIRCLLKKEINYQEGFILSALTAIFFILIKLIERG